MNEAAHEQKPTRATDLQAPGRTMGRNPGHDGIQTTGQNSGQHIDQHLGQHTGQCAGPAPGPIETVEQGHSNRHGTTTTTASGFAELDQTLPGGGWPSDELLQVLFDQGADDQEMGQRSGREVGRDTNDAFNGLGDLRLLMPALARLSHLGRWIALIAPPVLPRAHEFAAHGVDPSRILLVHPRQRSMDAHGCLWATELALRSGTCAAVLSWPEMAGTDVDAQGLQRLQQAAKAGGTWGIVFRTANAMDTQSGTGLRLAVGRVSDGQTLCHLQGVPRAAEASDSFRLWINPDRPRVQSLPLYPSHGKSLGSRGTTQEDRTSVASARKAPLHGNPQRFHEQRLTCPVQMGLPLVRSKLPRDRD